MRHTLVLACAALLLGVVPAMAAPIGVFPKGFTNVEVPTNGTTIHVRKGGQGPAVVLIHGFGDTGDMWAPVAKALIKDHTVIVPDLGLSSYPDRPVPATKTPAAAISIHVTRPNANSRFLTRNLISCRHAMEVGTT